MDNNSIDEIGEKDVIKVNKGKKKMAAMEIEKPPKLKNDKNKHKNEFEVPLMDKSNAD